MMSKHSQTYLGQMWNRSDFSWAHWRKKDSVWTQAWHSWHRFYLSGESLISIQLSSRWEFKCFNVTSCNFINLNYLMHFSIHLSGQKWHDENVRFCLFFGSFWILSSVFATLFSDINVLNKADFLLSADIKWRMYVSIMYTCYKCLYSGLSCTVIHSFKGFKEE